MHHADRQRLHRDSVGTDLNDEGFQSVWKAAGQKASSNSRMCSLVAHMQKLLELDTTA